MPVTKSAQQSNPFIRLLASSERKTRDRALSSLRRYLNRPAPFSELDFMKLWKGLFFCMWMQDKAFNQQRLARDLASLVDVLQGKENFLGFVRAFWKTMAREWEGIDALRMDKYLYLIRCYVSKGFERVGAGAWADEQLLDEYLVVLESVPLNARDGKIPNGLRFHVLDIYVDELEKNDAKKEAPIERIIAPLQNLEKNTFTKSVRVRTQEALDDDRLANWGLEIDRRQSAQDALSEDAEGDDNAEFGGFGD